MNFELHSHASPGTNWTSVKEYLGAKDAYDDLLEFLRSLSSELDPFPDGSPRVQNLLAIVDSDSTATLTWTTPQLSVSRLLVYSDAGDTVVSEIRSPATSHSVSVHLPTPSLWTAEVSTTYSGRIARGTTSWSNALFANRSADTSFDYSGTPYASIAFDYDDDDLDLFITDVGGPAGLMENVVNEDTPDVPRLLNRAGDEFALGEEPRENRGASAADYDNDGRIDLFVSGLATPKLYRNTGSQPAFTDVSASIGASFSSAADSSWTGAWGDYDRDGHVDLYVGRASGDDAEPTGPIVDRLFRNLGNGEFQTSALLAFLPMTSTTSASWADATGDGELDLFIGAGRAGESSLLLVQSVTQTPLLDFEHSFAVDSTRLPTSPSTLDEIRSVSWRDLNSDGALDLLLGGSTSGENGTRVLWNDGAGFFTSTSVIAGGFASKGQVAVDLDLDGHVDVVAAPASSAVQPGVFENEGNGATPSFVDRSAFAGMASSSADIRAIVAADLAGPSSTADGDEDVYLGRLQSTGAFFYQNVSSGTDVPANKWLRVELDRGDRANNELGIGALVTVTTTLPDASTLDQVQIVDGGSGAGSQAASGLTFGLGNTATGAEVSVRWPDGHVSTKSVSSAALDSTVSVVDDHDVTIADASIRAYPLASGGGNVDWVFDWETDYLASAQFDRVKVWGGKSPCTNLGTESQPTSLGLGTPGVSVEVFAKTGGGYLHRLTWSNRPCEFVCSYKYRVYSHAVDAGGAWSNQKTMSIPACIN